MIMNIYFFRSGFNWNEKNFRQKFVIFLSIIVIVHVLSIVSALTISINNDNSNQTIFSIPEQQDDQPFPAESSQHSFYGICCKILM